MLLFADNDPDAVDGARLSASSMPLASLYHLNAKFTREEAATDPDGLTSSDDDHSGAADALFNGLPRTTIPSDPGVLAMGLGDAIRLRRSAREFTGTSISSTALGTLLRYSGGVVHTDRSVDRRATPSGGAKYPVQLVPCVQAVDDVPAGVYGYDARVHGLVPLRIGGKSCEAIKAACLYPEVVEGAAVVVLLVASLTRSARKYRERGYRLAVQEAGHIAQNLTLVATAMGLGSVVLAGFDEHDVEEFLDLDGQTETMLSSVLVGHDAERSRSN